MYIFRQIAVGVKPSSILQSGSRYSLSFMVGSTPQWTDFQALIMSVGKGQRWCFSKTLSIPKVVKKTTPPLKLLEENDAKKVQCALSIDIGLKNISYAHISRDFRLLGWEVLALDKPKPYNPSMFVEMVKRIVDKLPRSDVAIIEIQSFYSRTENPSLFPFVLHNRITEAILHSLLMSHCSRIFGIDPNIVRKFFQIKKGKTKAYYSPSVLQDIIKERVRTNAKLADQQLDNFVVDHKADIGSKEFVLKCLEQRRTDSFISFQNITGSASKVLISGSQAQYYLDSINKGDLGDAFLQGVAFLEMEINRVNY